MLRKSLAALFAALTFVFSFSFSLPCNALSEKDISAPAAVLMDAGSGRVLYSKAPHDIRPCASVTKVMTLILVFEALDNGSLKPGDKITSSEHAASMGGSDIWLEPGEVMTADEMIKAVVVASANDAAVALAEYISGSEDEFVRRMNEKAAALGMKDTVFKNCNGLDEEGHVTSAYDVALMSRDLIRHREVLKYTGIRIDSLRGGKTQLVNTNKLLRSYKGITGLKTGTTSKAGSCISATAERDGLSLIAVVLGCSSGKERFRDAAKLLDHGFAGYAVSKLDIPAELKSRRVRVTGGMTGDTGVFVTPGKGALVEKKRQKEIESSIRLPESVSAPVKKGDVIGEIEYKISGSPIARYQIKAADNVEEISFLRVFLPGLRALCSG